MKTEIRSATFLQLKLPLATYCEKMSQHFLRHLHCCTQFLASIKKKRVNLKKKAATRFVQHFFLWSEIKQVSEAYKRWCPSLSNHTTFHTWKMAMITPFARMFQVCPARCEKKESSSKNKKKNPAAPISVYLYLYTHTPATRWCPLFSIIAGSTLRLDVDDDDVGPVGGNNDFRRAQQLVLPHQARPFSRGHVSLRTLKRASIAWCFHHNSTQVINDWTLPPAQVSSYSIHNTV